MTSGVCLGFNPNLSIRYRMRPMRTSFGWVCGLVSLRLSSIKRNLDKLVSSPVCDQVEYSRATIILISSNFNTLVRVNQNEKEPMIPQKGLIFIECCHNKTHQLELWIGIIQFLMAGVNCGSRCATFPGPSLLHKIVNPF
jgi:hypothetical protein